jgi:hypothetical protein
MAALLAAAIVSLLKPYFLFSPPDTSSVSFHLCSRYPASLQSSDGLRQCEMKPPSNLRPCRRLADARHFAGLKSSASPMALPDR